MKKTPAEPGKGARRKRVPARLTDEQITDKTVEQIIDEAVTIVGKDEHGIYKLARGDVGSVFFRLREQCAALGRLRSRESKQTARTVKQLGAALRRAKALPEDLRLGFGVDEMIWHLEQYEKVLGKKVVATGKFQIDVKTRKPRPNADDKRLAAEAALHLCELNSAELTPGQLSKLAAVLYGDRSADLRRHCREARKRKTGTKTALVLR